MANVPSLAVIASGLSPHPEVRDWKRFLPVARALRSRSCFGATSRAGHLGLAAPLTVLETVV